MAGSNNSNYKCNLENKSNRNINHVERDPRFNRGSANYTRTHKVSTVEERINSFQSSNNSNYVEYNPNVTYSQSSESFPQYEGFNQMDFNPCDQSQQNVNHNMHPTRPLAPNRLLPPTRSTEGSSLSSVQANLPPLSMPPPLPNIFPPLASFPLTDFQHSVAPSFPSPFPVVPCMPNSPFLNPTDTSVPPPFDSMCPPLNIVTTKDDKDPKKWLKMRLAHYGFSTKKKSIANFKITISEYKKKTAVLMNQIKELEKLTTHLLVMSKSLNNDDWTTRKEEIEKQKKVVQKAMDDLKIIPIPEILSLLNKRKSKRLRLKRKRKENKEMMKEEKALCQLEHSRIDMWLEKMKDQVERARRDEDIKKQADFVLSEVFHKKAEAKRMLTLLTTLGKLRNARIHDRESKGEFVSKEAASAFNSIIEKLKKLWVNQINGYNIEEQGLRVMLNDAKVKRSNVEESLNKQIIQQWTSIIFGNHHKNNPYQVNDIEQLITIRQSWDQYVVKDSVSSGGSNMPLGWILPVPPTNEVWAKFVKP